MKKLSIKNYTYSLFVSLFAFLVATPAKAVSIMQGTSPGCLPKGSCTLNDFVVILVNASKNFLGLSGSMALLFFVYGGVVFLISGGSSEKVTKGKQILIGSVIGMVIIFTSYTVIGFILGALDVPGKDNWFTSESIF